MKLEIEITEEELRSAIERKVRTAVADQTNSYGTDAYIKEQLLAVGLTAGLSGGRAAHEQWEHARGDENECDAEKRLHEEVSESGDTIPIEWWNGWLERSDEWRDEIEHAG